MRRRAFIVTVSCGAGLMLVLIVLALLAPSLIGQETLRQIIARELSRTLDTDAQVKRVPLSVLPRPRVVVSGVTLAFPENAS